MANLKEQLGRGDQRQAIIEESCHVLDQEVADKTGLSAIAVKSAYKLVKGVKPGFIRQVVDHLLDEFLDALDPIYQEALTQGARPGAHLNGNGGRVADALLAVTDGRAAKAEHGAIKKTYEKLRPTARKHVEAAVPRLGEMLDRHTP